MKLFISFLAFSKGSNYFLLPVCWNIGTFYCILASMFAISLFLAAIILFTLSLAIFSFAFTVSTSYIFDTCVFETFFYYYETVFEVIHSPITFNVIIT